MTPRVSVLLPVRDGADHLPGCIDSLRGQSLRDLEVVAVDDGSSDGSGEILEARARDDPRIRVVRQEPRGLVPALERARRLARAPLLARMDHDDVALPRRLETQVDLLAERPDLVLCGCLVRTVPRAGMTDGARRYERWLNGLVEPHEIERDLLVECPVAHPTFMVRASALAAVGGYRDRGWPEDYDLLLRLWHGGGTFAKVPEVLLEWRDRPDRLQRRSGVYAPEAFRRCKVDALRRSLLPGRDGVVVWGAGPTGKGFARSLRAAGVPLVAFVDLDPRKIGQEIHGAPVVAPEGISAFRGAFCVAAVGQPGARAEIRAALRDAGWREMEDFCAVA
ncbi:MAG TPA: glycosyltransferase [Longimicrobiales bacterium]|nr:glycosyltransferase [Longimicrobiales bacterium]